VNPASPRHDAPIPTLGDAPHRVPPPPWHGVIPPGARVHRGLTGTLQGFLWAGAGVAAIVAALSISSLVTFDDFVDSDLNSLPNPMLEQRWIEQDEALEAMSALFMTLWLVVIVLLVVWMHKSHKASQTMWSGSRKWTQGWTVGGWFVPIANFWIPKSVVDEIEQIVTAPRIDGRVEVGWNGKPTSALGWTWWFGLVAGVLPWMFSNGLSTNAGDPSSVEVKAYYSVRLMSFTCWAASCVAGAIYVRRLTHAVNQ
jgi:Domain of unknown function (DUF4328)